MKYLIVLILILLNIFKISYCHDGGVTPKSVKIAFTQLTDQIRVTWYTDDISNDPVVLYSSSPFSPEKDSSLVVDAQVISYKSSDTGFTGHPTTGVIQDLEELTTYYYCVGDKSEGVYSQVYNFTTGYFSSNSNSGEDETFEQFTLAFYGDMGYGGQGLQSDHPTINNLLERSNDVDFIIHVGDIAYADLVDKTDGNQTIWNLFLESITPLASNKPYMTCPGNHDLFYDDLSIYSRTWKMPTDNESDTWYSFNYNGVHFVGFSSEHDYFPGSTQFEWLENDLKTFRASNPNGWLIAYSHRPFYCSAIWDWCDDNPTSSNDFNDSEDDKKSKDLSKSVFNLLEDLLYKYNVDLYLAGHQHAEEYAYPVYKGEILGDFSNPKATTHITAGTGGNADGSIAGWQSKPSWSASMRITDPGFGLLTFTSTSITYQFISNSNNTVIDQFTLSKGQFN